MSKFFDVWKVSEKDFPDKGTPADKLAFCVRYAILAPSVYNTQPWYFRIANDVCALYADRRYALPVIDPDDRTLSMACAAALYNLKLAIRHFGYKETTDLLPDPSDENLLARVRLGASGGGADADTETLFKAIVKRHTNRGVFQEKSVPEDLLRQLQSAAARENGWLHVCAPAERRAVLRLVSEADHMQTGDKHFRRELAAWTDPRRDMAGEGLAYLGLKYSDVINKLSPTVARRFAGVNGNVANEDELDRGSPIIAVLGSTKGGSQQRMIAGQAMMRVLLQAEALGLSVSSLSQPCEVPSLRLMLHDELEIQGRVQMIFRIGYGGKPVYSPRRPVSDVIEYEGGLAGIRKAANDTIKKGLLSGFGLFRKK